MGNWFSYSGGSDWCRVNQWYEDDRSVDVDICWDKNQGEERTTTLYFYDNQNYYSCYLTITQYAGITYYQYVEPTTATIANTGGSSEHILYTNRTGGSWSKSGTATGFSSSINGTTLKIEASSNVGAQPSFSSLSTTSMSFGNGGGSKTSTATVSSGSSTSARSINVAVSYSGYSAGTVTVTQSGFTPNSASYSISDNADWITTSRNGNTITVTTSANQGSAPTRPTFTAFSASPTSFTYSGGTGTMSYTVNAGSSGSSKNARSGTVTVSYGGTSKTITVSQDGYSPGSGYSTAVSVSSDVSWITINSNSKFTVKSNAASASTASLTLSSASTTCVQGGGSGSFTASYSGGTGSTNTRTGTITATCADASGTKSRSVTITQSGQTITASLSVSSNKTWLTVSRSGSTISWSATTNASSSSRSGIITVTYGGVSKTFTVTQSGAAAVTFTMTGGNKLATRSDFNSQIRSYYSSDTSRVITGEEINNMTWTSGAYTYKVTLKSSYSGGRCAICSDIQCTYNYTN